MAIDFKMAWRNVWRNTRRSILTICAIAFATLLLIFMLSWQFGSYDTMINAAVRTQSGHIQIQAKDYNDKRTIRLVVSNPAQVSTLLDSVSGVSAYTFRASAFSLLSSEARTYGAAVIGIDPKREARVSTLKTLVRKGYYLSRDYGNEALIGRLLAKNLQVGIGDEVVLLGQGRDGSIAATVVKVKGIYSSGQDVFDRSSIQIPIKTFQEVYSMGNAVNNIVVICENLDKVQELKKALETGVKDLKKGRDLAILDWTELMPGLIQAIRMDLCSGLIMYMILIVVVAFSILNTFLMAILERTREFGILMAVGIKPGRLTRILLMESTAMTIVGIIAGIIAGCLVTWYFQVHGIYFSDASELLRQYGMPERMHPQLSFLSVAIGAGIVMIITVLTALYPALKVRRLRPIEAMSAV